MKTLLALAAGAALLGGSATFAQDNPSSSAAMSTPDYVMAAGRSDLFEIQEGKLAQQMGGTARIKAFGAQMVKDHTKSTDMVVAAAHKSGMTPNPPMLGPAQQTQIDQLKATHGAQFDRMYLSQQMASHQSALSVQKAYAKTGTDKNLKMAATKIVPVVEHHISELKAMGASAS